MVSIGKKLGKKTVALITDMNQPLGHEIGNANEVREAISVLRGAGEERLTSLCLTLAAHMLVAGGRYAHLDQAYAKLNQILDSGGALETFKRFVAAQGGDPRQIDEPDRLPQAPFHVPLKAEQEGYVTRLDAEGIGKAAMMLGAGRLTKEDHIDHSVGITLYKKVGDYVHKGDRLAVLHSKAENPEESIALLKQSISIRMEKVSPPPLIYKIVE
jgi:pyrimidine-nucleoside phosphorylase